MSGVARKQRGARAGRPAQTAAIARELAVNVLKDVRQGEFAEHALAAALDRTDALKPEDRGLATELVYGVLRWVRRLDALMQRCSHHPLSKISPDLRAVLRVALYQLFLLDAIPPYAAVNDAVTQARQREGPGAARLTNALLRRVLREKASIDQPMGRQGPALARYYSHPDWLVKRWVDRWGITTTERILEFNNSRPSLVVRVNRLKCTPEMVEERFAAHGLRWERAPGWSDALMLRSVGCPIQHVPGFAEGYFVVQDLASQMIAPLLRARPGDHVLDACAAPGIKAAHVAALTQGRARLTVADRNADRMREAEELLGRLGVNISEAVCADVSALSLRLPHERFDRVLVDAPCANLGVLRHNPEAKYRLRSDDLRSFGEEQLRILREACRFVRPGGLLLFAICSVSWEETFAVVRSFCSECDNFSPDPITSDEVPVGWVVQSDGALCTFPIQGVVPMDGFFAARFRRLS